MWPDSEIEPRAARLLIYQAAWRVKRLGEGAAEAQRMVVARELLGCGAVRFSGR